MTKIEWDRTSTVEVEERAALVVRVTNKETGESTYEPATPNTVEQALKLLTTAERESVMIATLGSILPGGTAVRIRELEEERDKLRAEVEQLRGQRRGRPMHIELSFGEVVASTEVFERFAERLRELGAKEGNKE